MAKDYYKILGVDKSATPADIKQAFRKLAHQHHPDKAGGDEQKFKEINEAYQVLSNPEKRQQYDQYGQTFEQARSQGGFSGFEGFRDFSDFASAFRNGSRGGQNFSFEGDLGDIFSDLFGVGGRSRGRRQADGQDIQISLTVAFLEAVFGTEKEISLEKNVVCNHCSGNGAEPGSKTITCQTCNGRGQVTQTIGFGIGFQSVCPDCRGAGKKAEKNCSKCHGGGVIKERKNIRVKIPAGVDNGQTIRLTGEGQAGRGGSSTGDLYINIEIIGDKDFTRNGYDIFAQREISFTQAALGDKIQIKTVDGNVKLKIPEGTQGGKKFRIKGKGVPHLQGRGRGDHIVKIVVSTPQRLSRRQKELFKELQDLD